MLTVELPSLHAGQISVYRGRKRFNVLECGRRWGKTLFGVVLACEGAIEGQLIGWFAPTYKYLMEAWRDMLKILAPVLVASNVQEKRIEVMGGGVIECWTMDTPDPGRSRKYHKVFIDEGGLVKSLTEIWNSSIRATLADFKGEGWFLGTPKGRREFHAFFERAAQGKPNWASFRMPTATNPAIDPEEIEDARRELPPEVFAQEFEGIPADNGGNPFGMAAIAACFGPIVPGKPVVYGIDLAKSQDWTVVIGLDGNGQECYFDRWQGPWGDTKRRIMDKLDAPAIADATGVGDPIVEELQHNSRFGIEAFKFSQTSKQQIMEGLAAGIQTNRFKFSTDVIRSELELFEYEYTRSGVRYEAPRGMHDDCVCAAAMAWHKFSRMGRTPMPRIVGGTAAVRTSLEHDESMWEPVGRSTW